MTSKMNSEELSATEVRKKARKSATARAVIKIMICFIVYLLVAAAHLWVAIAGIVNAETMITSLVILTAVAFMITVVIYFTRPLTTIRSDGDISHPMFALAVLVSSSLVLSQIQVAAADSGSEMSVVRTTYQIVAPRPGEPIVLPDSLPADVQATVLKILQETEPGGAPIVLTSGEVPQQYSKAIDQEVEKVKRELAVTGNTSPSQPIVQACLVWVLIIITIIVAGITLYVLWRCCKLLDKPQQTNSPPSEFTANIGVGGTVKSLAASTDQHMNLRMDANSSVNVCEMEASTNLGSNWFPICKIAQGPWLQVTNIGIPPVDWMQLIISGTNGEVIATTWLQGLSNTNVFGGTTLQQVGSAIPIPNQTVGVPHMFFRISQQLH